MSNKETALKFVERVINGHDLNAIDQLLSADFVEHSAPPGFASNRAGVKEMFGAFLAAFPDMHARIDDVIVEGTGGTKIGLIQIHMSVLVGTPRVRPGRPTLSALCRADAAHRHD